MINNLKKPILSEINQECFYILLVDDTPFNLFILENFVKSA